MVHHYRSIFCLVTILKHSVVGDIFGDSPEENLKVCQYLPDIVLQQGHDPFKPFICGASSFFGNNFSHSFDDKPLVRFMKLNIEAMPS